MSSRDLEDELDQALRDLELDESTPTIDPSGVSPEPIGRGAPDELIEIDFGAGAATDDGFEEERAKERAAAAASVAGRSTNQGRIKSSRAGGLADRLLDAKGGGGSHLSKHNRIILSIGILGCVALVVYMLSGLMGMASVVDSSPGVVLQCSSLQCPPAADCSDSFSHKTHIWSTDSDSQLAEPASTAIVVVGHAPSSHAIARLLELADGVRVRKNRGIDFWVSFDNTFAHNSTHTLITELESHALRLIIGRDIKLHEFQGDAVFSRYPVLERVPYCKNKLQKSIIPPPNAKSCEGQSATQIEALLMWWKHEKVIGRNYDYVWVLDDDVGVSGNIADLVSEYDDIPDDLLTHEGCLRTSDKVGEQRSNSFVAGKHDYKSGSLVSSGFATFYADHYFSLDYVQRFSARMLDELDTCSLRQVSADRKELPCTVCMNNGFSCGALSADHVGNPFTKWDTPQLTSASWNSTKKSGGAFFHPLSF